MKIRNIPKKIISGLKIIKNDGVITFFIRFMMKLQRASGKKHEIRLLVKPIDVELADWSQPLGEKNKSSLPAPKNKKLIINWVMSPPGKGSGGHQNLFRFMQYLEKAGHTNRIFLYTNHPKPSLKDIHEVLEESYPKISASIEWYNEELPPSHAIFATGWETAYPVFNNAIKALRFYFVQDFEPYFYPVGSEYILAENTYRFGFQGVTAGGWLAKKLHDDYGMETDYFNFGADTNLYTFKNDKERKEVFFYARPVTARRGFELGLMALEIFHKKHPEYIINLAGWDVSEYKIPFPYVNLMSLPLEELVNIYNRCAVALVISLTNMSLMPLELLACGTIPVVNDGENNRLVSNNPYIAYTPNNPRAMAEKMSEHVSSTDQVDYARRASDSVNGSSWNESGAKFVKIVEEKLLNG